MHILFLTIFPSSCLKNHEHNLHHFLKMPSWCNKQNSRCRIFLQFHSFPACRVLPPIFLFSAWGRPPPSQSSMFFTMQTCEWTARVLGGRRDRPVAQWLRQQDIPSTFRINHHCQVADQVVWLGTLRYLSTSGHKQSRNLDLRGQDCLLHRDPRLKWPQRLLGNHAMCSAVAHVLLYPCGRGFSEAWKKINLTFSISPPCL